MDLDFEDVLLTPSDVLEHLFCGRFTYFERHLLLPEFQERREKVRRGRALHAVREATNRAYVRKRLGVVEKRIDVSLASARHHLRGRLDEVLFFGDGTAGPLDYKFAKDPGRVYTTLRVQSAIYALLIHANFGIPVRRGYLVYTRSSHRVVEVAYDPADFRRIGRAVREILEVIHRGKLPRRAPASRCVDCCYRPICV
jgi:CRISPR-associated exonuclease Cas4